VSGGVWHHKARRHLQPKDDRPPQQKGDLLPLQIREAKQVLLLLKIKQQSWRKTVVIKRQQCSTKIAGM
jgi:hypothetical protein